jgi:hypothetical protein
MPRPIAWRIASEAIRLQVIADFGRFLKAMCRNLEFLNSGHSYWADLPKRENRAKLCVRIDGELTKAEVAGYSEVLDSPASECRTPGFNSATAPRLE